MRWTARVLSAPSADTDTCLSCFFETQPSHKYIFNCGESTFRAIQQRKYGLTKLKGLFLTGINAQTSAGVPGLLMSLADSGTKEFTLVGPPGLNHFLASTRFYAMREAIELNRFEIHPTERDSIHSSLVFRDENLSIFAVPISPIGSTSTVNAARSRSRSPSRSPKRASPGAHDITIPPTERVLRQMFCGGSSLPDGTFERRTPLDWRLHRSALPRAPRATAVAAYIGLGPVVRGKFDAKRATELGILGPARALLTKGQSVLAKDGVTMVTPDMCIGPNTPASAFMIIDCPDPSYIEALISSKLLNVKIQLPEARLSFILHRVGRGVLEDGRYVQWMNSFDSEARHLIASPDYCTNAVSFVSSANLQLGLSHLDRDIFTHPSPSDASRNLPSIPNLPPNTEPLQLDHQIGLNPIAPPRVIPTQGMIDRFKPALEAKFAGKHDPNISRALSALFQKLRTEVEAEGTSRPKQPGDDVVITTLGTGSALPSKYRNVLATLVQVPRWGHVLLDAGEGTWGQIARRFGIETVSSGDSSPAESPADQVLREIRCVFISHLHADHHIGLSKLLVLRNKLKPPPRPLYLIAGQEVMDYLTEYDNLDDLGLNNVRFIENSEVASFTSPAERKVPSKICFPDLAERRRISIEAHKNLVNEMGFKSVETVGVQHRGPCYGIVLRHQDGWSLAFSGDTVPSNNLIQAGKGVSVLIHEASLSDDEEKLAIAKQHSTVGQAIDVGKRMEAEAILLTHFSQRYPKIPILKGTRPLPEGSASVRGSPPPLTPVETSQKNTEPVVALAFDCASIPIGSMWKMSRYKPALERLFAELEEPGGDDDEVALRAANMGVPTKALESVAETSSGSRSGSDGKVRAGNEEASTKKPAPKKQKVSSTKSKAVG